MKKVEESFFKDGTQSNVLELVVNEITEKELNYPCSEHAEDVFAYIISFYLQNRMRQFAKVKMADAKRTNAEMKKASKLTET